ncbi:MAG: NUDIX hydrolase [Nitrospirae bacterium]|nr:NUDIX hydrolase [Nitrospirota bacterium]MCL5977282.1 NUDIX hydrolase [Nitrospirota bacterium]
MEIIDKKIVWEGRFLRTLLITYKDRSGSIRNWEAVERVNCDGIVVVVPVTEHKEFLLIRQFRPVLNGFVVEFPAGLNDKGESLIDAARRELIEETEYTADEFVHLTDGPVSSGMSTEILSVFLALNSYPASDAVKEQHPADESESIEVIKTPLDKIYETLHARTKDGDHIDMKVYGLIELAKKRL